MAGLPLAVEGAEEALGAGEAIIKEAPVLARTPAVKNILHTLGELGKKAMDLVNDFNSVVSGVQNAQTVIEAVKPKHSEPHTAHKPAVNGPAASQVTQKLDGPQPSHHSAAETPAGTASPQRDHENALPAVVSGSHHHLGDSHAKAEPIAFGSTGPAVREIQHQLGVHVDGMDGPQTTAALNAFKRAHDLRPDGIAGPETRAELAAEPMVREGSQGEAVRRIQERLGIRADGLDGSQTTAAVKAFQESHGLAVDGIVGIETWKILDAAAETRARTAESPVLHIRYGNDETTRGSGFQQSGTIMSVVDGVVTQSAGRSVVKYELSELTANTPDRAALEKLLVPGQEVKISVDHHGVNVAPIEHNRQLDRTDSGR